MSPYQVTLPSSLEVSTLPQDLSVAGYGMSSLSASGATIASPDSSLKPELRFSTFFFYFSQLLVAETIVFTSWKHLQNFRLTASQKVAAKGEGGDFQTVQTLSSPTLLIFALILTCKWNQRILCDWTQSNQTRQPSSFARNPNPILCICLQGNSTKLTIGCNSGKPKKVLKKENFQKNSWQIERIWEDNGRYSGSDNNVRYGGHWYEPNSELLSKFSHPDGVETSKLEQSEQLWIVDWKKGAAVCYFWSHHISPYIGSDSTFYKIQALMWKDVMQYNFLCKLWKEKNRMSPKTLKRRLHSCYLAQAAEIILEILWFYLLNFIDEVQ